MSNANSNLVLSILSNSAHPMGTFELARAAARVTGHPMVSFLDAIKWHDEIQPVRVYHDGIVVRALIVREAGERVRTVYSWTVEHGDINRLQVPRA